MTQQKQKKKVSKTPSKSIAWEQQPVRVILIEPAYNPQG